MTKYLVSFPGSAMDISGEDMAAAGDAARAVIRDAKNAGVYVFGGGINEDVAPLMVAADGSVSNETYPQTREWICRRGKPPSNGPPGSPKPAAARRNCGSSATTPRAELRGCDRQNQSLRFGYIGFEDEAPALFVARR